VILQVFKLKKQIWKEMGTCFVALILCLWIAVILLKLWRADWHIPFFYQGDATFYSMIIKGINDNGWHLRNAFLGMPWGTELHDFPIPDTFHLLLIKLMTLFTSDHALILNLFFVITFPLTTITALTVFRHFKISPLPAILGSLLYTFTPYHLNRSENHLMYSAYYIVPLMIMVILWICVSSQEANKRDRQCLILSLRSPKFIFSLVICVLIASTGGVYYSFFSCCLLLVIGLILAIGRRRFRHVLLPGVLVAVISTTMMANLSPSIIYQLKYGKTSTAQRIPAEAEIYSLKIAQLLLPINGHRIVSWKQLKDKYNYNPLINENADSALGLVGSIGFLTLLGWLLIRGVDTTSQKADDTGHLLSYLSVLNMSAVLLGTTGGFGALFALLVSPQIRAPNRISVYIAFFAFFTVILLLDRVGQRFFRTRGWRVAFHMLIVCLIVIGVLDQSSEYFVPDYAGTQAEYRHDAEFISQVEATVPPGSMIFQLPVKRFPETAPIERLWDYDLFKGYLHSQRLRWTYGAMRDREGDMWQAWVVAKPLHEMVEIIAVTGFNGIYVDRFGYADNAAKLENDLASLLGTTPLVSKNERLAFFNLSAYQQKLQERYTAQELQAKHEEALYLPSVSWDSGFYGLEGAPGGKWRWCRSTGQLTLTNWARGVRRVTIEMFFATATEGNLRIESPSFSEQVITKPELVPFSKTIEIPPGKYTINFASDAQRVYAPPDPRVLVFRVINFKLKSAD